MSETPPTRFTGYQPLNFTPIPDELFDRQLPDLSGAELKVLLYIFRHTYGWRKQSDNISINQIIGGVRRRSGEQLDRGTGLSRDSVTRAIKTLEEHGYILVLRHRSQHKGDEPTTYALNIDASSLGEGAGGSPKIGLGGDGKIGLGGVRKSDPQDTTLQETMRQEHSNDSNGTRPDFDRQRETGISAIADRQGTEPAPSSQPLTTQAPRRRQTTGRLPRVSPGFKRFIEELSHAYHDDEHVPSNIAQARNLLAKARLDESVFITAVYQARSITNQSTVNKPAAGGNGARNKMPFFFACLRDVLGLDQEPGPMTISDQELQASLDVRPITASES